MNTLKPFTPLMITLLLYQAAPAQTAEPSPKTPCLSCEEVRNLHLPDVSISHTEMLQEPAGHCKVSGIIGREIHFELTLPNTWNARFVMGGNGGFAGSIQYDHAQVRDGYATAGTDTGHQGSGITADWAFHHMERQLNFGHLAVHRTAVTSKEIIRQYYCSEPAYSYFIGCSRGGGQAMMEAQRYPEDFDGIVAGAPAFNWPAIGAEFIQNCQAVYPNPATLHQPVISLANLKLLQTIVLAQCDTIDGLKDQILNDPRDCDFDFEALPQCPDNTPSEDCFTLQQIEAIKVIYEGVRDEQQEVYPGFPLGGENEPGGWQPWITGPNEGTMELNFPSLHFAFGTEMFKYLVYQDSLWDYSTYDFTRSSSATRYASSYLDATSTDYIAFKQHGGKMILYHGWNDPALSSLATIDHYEAARKKDATLENYIRLYLLPGVLHCGGGPGPSEVNWLSLVRDWVEKGNAPEKVVLSKTEDGKTTMSRPVFPYPNEAVYDGKGDPNAANSFHINSPDKQR